MEKKWMAILMIASALTLSACNGGEKAEETKPVTTKPTAEANEKAPDAETKSEVSSVQSSIQSNIPFDQLYQDPQIRNYAERFIGVEAPDFTLQNVDGQSVSLNDFKGQNVILEMAQTTCHVCVDAQPKLDSFQKENPDITIVQVFNESPDAVKNFLKTANTTSIQHSLTGDASSVFDDYEVDFVPLLLFIDKEGMIKLIHVGQVGDHELLNLFTELSFQ